MNHAFVTSFLLYVSVFDMKVRDILRKCVCQFEVTFGFIKLCNFRCIQEIKNKSRNYFS